ncbi:MAG TPA: cyclase family protein [Longimicrobiales bacterium]|nr:cyclase family protein [Longimicrobiales bacterium]
MPHFYDITLPITEDLVVYPGDPEIRLRPHSRIADGDPANVTSIAFGSHTGTHVDAPRHFFDEGRAVDELSLDVLIGPAVVLEIPRHVRSIGPEDLREAGYDGAGRLLLKTGNASLPHRREFVEEFAFLSEAAALFLVEAGVRLVGIDYLSVEAFDATHAPVHHVLLRAGVVILEGIDLRQVPAGEYELICLPLRLAGLDGSPVRAVLRAKEP